MNIRNSLVAILALCANCLPVFAQSVLLSQFPSSGVLAGYIAVALQKHPSVGEAWAQIQSSQSEVKGSRWKFWPTPSLLAERVDTRDPAYAAGDDQILTMRLEQPLWSGGRLTGNLARAEAQALLAQANLRDSQQKLALQIIQTWTEADVAQEKLVAYQVSLAAHERLLALVQRRAKEGLSSVADVDLARARRESIAAESSAVRAQLDTALVKLNLLTFSLITPSQLRQAREQEVLDESAGLDSLLQGARENSTQLAKARAQEELAQADIQIAKSALSPEIYVRAERQMGSYTNAALPPQNRVFVGMATAFGGGLSSLTGVQAATARHIAAQDAMRAEQLLLDAQIHGDVNLVRNARQRQQNLELARVASAGVSSSWERQFLAGRKQWQELMNAAREQLQTETQLIDAVGAQRMAGWRLQVLTQDMEDLIQVPGSQAVAATKQKR